VPLNIKELVLKSLDIKKITEAFRLITKHPERFGTEQTIKIHSSLTHGAAQPLPPSLRLPDT
jgi:hypothetical protein